MFELLLAGQLFRRRVLCREEQLLLRIFREGSRQLKLNRASPAKQGAESSSRPFSTWCSSACRSTRKLCDLKSPAAIGDQGLFQAIFKARISIKCDGLFLFGDDPWGVVNVL